MRFVIVTGMSGAGKSTALKMFEDFGYFCVDNLPIPLIKTFAKIAYDENTEIDNVAIGIDIRNGKNSRAHVPHANVQTSVRSDCHQASHYTPSWQRNPVKAA